MKILITILAALMCFLAGATTVLAAIAYEGGWADGGTHVSLALVPVAMIFAVYHMLRAGDVR